MTAPGPRARRLALVAAVAGAVVAADQLTKSLALDQLADGPVDLFWTLRLTLSFNRGAAFSVATDLTPVITVVALALVAGLVLFARQASGPMVSTGLGLLLGGAVGNLSDRLFRGHGGAVVDFIDIGRWPVFNVADIGVTIGAVVVVVASGLDERRRQRAGAGTRDDGDGAPA